MRFQPELLEGIRRGYDLSEAVGNVVSLRPIGDDNIGKCPFHQDSTASFRVNKRRYICFGCRERGDIISWYCKHYGLTFPDAVKRLSRADLQLPTSLPARSAPTCSEYDAFAVWRTIEANNAAQKIWEDSQRDQSLVYEYANSRNLFGNGIGFCDVYDESSWGIPHGIDAGLLTHGLDGIPYCRYANRITIPLRGPSGHILGFTGRAVPGLTSERAPKYLDPKASPAYQKKRYLYGLDKVKGKVRGRTRLAVVEGPLDAIAFHSEIPSVATMGCSLTQEQARVLAHYASTVVITYDGDMPGIEAAFPAAQKCTNECIETHIAILPNGCDPAEWASQFDHRDYLHLAWFKPNEIMSSQMASQYDTTLMQSIAKPYVEDNIKAGFPHYNVIDYVMQAQPEFAQEIRDAVIAMRDGCVQEGDKMVPQRAHVVAVLNGWYKACRALRVKNGKEK